MIASSGGPSCGQLGQGPWCTGVPPKRAGLPADPWAGWAGRLTVPAREDAAVVNPTDFINERRVTLHSRFIITLLYLPDRPDVRPFLSHTVDRTPRPCRRRIGGLSSLLASRLAS